MYKNIKYVLIKISPIILWYFCLTKNIKNKTNVINNNITTFTIISLNNTLILLIINDKPPIRTILIIFEEQHIPDW